MIFFFLQKVRKVSIFYICLFFKKYIIYILFLSFSQKTNSYRDGTDLSFLNQNKNFALLH